MAADPQLYIGVRADHADLLQAAHDVADVDLRAVDALEDQVSVEEVEVGLVGQRGAQVLRLVFLKDCVCPQPGQPGLVGVAEFVGARQFVAHFAGRPALEFEGTVLAARRLGAGLAQLRVEQAQATLLFTARVFQP